MRQALVDVWPAFSVVYGLHPWHIDELTADELSAYAEQLPRFLPAKEDDDGV